MAVGKGNPALSSSSVPKFRPGTLPKNRTESLGEISILIDEKLFTRHLSCLGELQASIPTGSAKLFSENAITWTRKTSQEHRLSTPFVVLVFDAHEVIVDIRSGDRESIKDFLHKWRQRIPLQHTKIYYLIIGGKILSGKLASEVNKQFRRCVMEGGRLQLAQSKAQVSWIDLEQLLWIVGVEMGIHIQFIDKGEMLCSHLVEFSRNVAWEPYAHRNENANFCVISNKKCGKTLTETWKRFLEEIGRVTSITANAIVAKYPTMPLLLDKYLTLSVTEAALLLSDTQVGTKTIGPALSRRIHRILTSSESSQPASL
jgi:hypothetical protein